MKLWDKLGMLDTTNNPKRAHLEKNQVWAFNERGEQVAVTWMTALDNLDITLDDAPTERKFKAEVVLKLVDAIMDTPTPKAVFREMYTLTFVYWPERLDSVSQKEAADCLGVSPQAFNQRLLRLMEARGIPVRERHRMLFNVQAEQEEFAF